MTPCPECNGAGFEGSTGPVVERLCEQCRGTGELPETPPANLKAAARLDEIVFRQIFYQMEENRLRRGD